MESLLVRDLQHSLERRPVGVLRAELGPFLLLQQPPAAVYDHVAKLLGRGQTVGMARAGRLGDDILGMLRGFQNLRVWSLRKLLDLGSLQVGRSEECDVVIHEPSVSSLHAQLKWNGHTQSCAISDLQSRNGTFVNARLLATRELTLQDGDALSFGDAPFLLLRPETLQQQLASFAQHGGG